MNSSPGEGKHLTVEIVDGEREEHHDADGPAVVCHLFGHNVAFTMFRHSLHFLRDISPVALGNLLFWEKFRTHTDARNSCFHPSREVLCRRFDRSGSHNHRPGERSLDILHEGRTRPRSPGREYLYQVASQLLGCTYLGNGTAAWRVGDSVSVAQVGLLRDSGKDRR